MKTFRKELIFNTSKRIEFINITEQVQYAIDESGIKEGFCLVNAMHITASVFINDHEYGLHSDFEKWLEKLAPHQPINSYRHNDTGEDNADSHLKDKLWAEKLQLLLQKAVLILDRGNKYFTVNLTA